MPRTPPLIGTIRKKSTVSLGATMVTPHRTPLSSSTTNHRLAWKKKKQKFTPEEVGRLRRRQDIAGGSSSDSSSSRAPGLTAGNDSRSEYVDSLSSDSEIEVVDMIHPGKLAARTCHRVVPAIVHSMAMY